jgi:transposase
MPTEATALPGAIERARRKLAGIAIYVFRGKRADRVKLIFWSGTGARLFSKRLDQGKFRWPRIEDGVMRLSAARLSALLEGLDWRRVRAAKETPAPALPG